jgi:predicted DCC family thiol-disulfide oxidoreductase YuxK
MKVLYDDDCEFCRELLLDMDIPRADLIPFSDVPPNQYGLSENEFHVITQSGVYSGGDGLRYLVQRRANLPRSIINNPLVQQVFNMGYRGVADNRSTVSSVYFLSKDIIEDNFSQ